MLTFVVVRSKPGRRVSASTVALLETAHPVDLAFVPDDHLVWCDRAGATRAAAWQVGADRLGVGSRWDLRPSGATLFSGHVWCDAKPWPGGASWASGLADRLHRSSLAALAPRLDGIFAALALSPDGRGELVTDPLGVAIVYRAETPDVVVLSNRASLAARLVAPDGQEPGRDLEGAAWMAYSGYAQSERTTFEGVEALPQGSTVRFAPDDAPRVVPTGAPPWLNHPGGDAGGTLDDRIDTAIGRMRSLTRTFVGLPASVRTVELTGGRDSRLVLALLLAEDLTDDVVFVSWGPAGLPDVATAAALADRFDLDLRAEGVSRRPRRRPGGDGTHPEVDPPPDLAFSDRVRHHVWATSGAVSLFDLGVHPRATLSHGSALSGFFGETFRSNHPATTGLRTAADLAAYVRNGWFGSDPARLLHPEVRRRCDRAVIDLLDGLTLSAGGSARPTIQDAIDGLYQRTRVRRWLGPAHEVDVRARLFPLYVIDGVRAAFAMGSDRRRAEVMSYEVVRRCDERLLSAPFAEKPWPSGADQGASGPAARSARSPRALMTRAAARVPRPAADAAWTGARARFPGGRPASTRAAEIGRMEGVVARLDALHDLVDLPADHRFHDLVDRRALARAIDRLPELPFLARRGVHDAVTAAVWLSGGEQRDPTVIPGGDRDDDAVGFKT